MRPEIQALRALAVGLVLIYHVQPHLVPGGFVGVDVFFVLSGFLIIGHLLRDLERGRLDILGFWARRIRRLLPASMTVLLAAALATIAVVPEALWRTTFAQITASALYVQNWVLASNAVDYLAADDSASIVQHFWSLSVEEQFYLVTPLVFAGVALLTRNSRRAIFATLAVIALASLASSVWLTATDPALAYFATYTRAWEFAAGGLLAFAPSLRGRLGPTLLSWGGLAAIALSAFVITGATPFPGWAALLPVLGTLAVIAGGDARGPLGSGRLLALRPVQYVGDISYSLYLWHWPLVVLVPYSLGIPIGTGAAILILLASGALAAITKPVIEDRFRRPSPRRWTAFAFAAAGALVLAAVGAGAVASLDLRRQATVDAIVVAEEQAPDCFGALGALNRCTPDPVPPLDAAFAADDLEGIDRGGCGEGTALEPIADARVCEFGDPAASETVILVGDSHARAWTGAVEAVAREQGWRLIVMARISCPLIDGQFVRAGVPDDGCLDWRAGAWERIRTENPDRVVLAGLRAYGYERFDWDLGSPEEQVAGYERTLDALVAEGIDVTVLGDVPYFPVDVPTCLAQSGAAGCVFPRSEVATAYPDALAAAARDREDIRFVDVESIVCDTESCPTVLGGVAAYRDPHHVSATFSRSFAPILAEAMLR